MPGGEVEWLVADLFEGLGGRGREDGGAGVIGIFGEVEEAGGVSGEVVDGDGAPGGGAVWEVVAGGVGDLEFALFFELEDGDGGELLGEGAEAEFGVGGVGDVVLGVGKAVAVGEEHLSVFGDEDGAHEGVVFGCRGHVGHGVLDGRLGGEGEGSEKGEG